MAWDRPTSGHIHVDNQALEAMDENTLALYRRRTIGFIFQSFNLISSLSALENVAYPLRFSGVSRRRRQAIARDLLQRVGLGDRLTHKPAELSGGQQQRVAVARALVNNPQLHPGRRTDRQPGHDQRSGHHASCWPTCTKIGRTVLVVSHDPRMQAYATDTVYMLDGRLVPRDEYETAVTVI
ncbi:MAG: ATP-binding cassette domain-containing protein [Chloroflexi bacterium]|nr:ATP-binding cassette domain-containing protein [Chloroflexota bacterium]